MIIAEDKRINDMYEEVDPELNNIKLTDAEKKLVNNILHLFYYNILNNEKYSCLFNPENRYLSLSLLAIKYAKILNNGKEIIIIPTHNITEISQEFPYNKLSFGFIGEMSKLEKNQSQCIRSLKEMGEESATDISELEEKITLQKKSNETMENIRRERGTYVLEKDQSLKGIEGELGVQQYTPNPEWPIENYKYNNYSDKAEIQQLDTLLFDESMDISFYEVNGYLIRDPFTKKIISYVLFEFKTANSIYISSLGTAETYTGRGFASSLIKKVLFDYPKYVFTLKVNMSDKKSQDLIKFYEKLGFKIIYSSITMQYNKLKEIEVKFGVQLPTFIRKQFRTSDERILQRPVPLTKYKYANKFYKSNTEVMYAMGNATQESSEFTLTAMSSIANQLTPILASFAYFNPDGKDSKAKTMALVEKNRELFNKMNEDGRLDGFAKNLADALPDATPIYTEAERDYLIDRKRKEFYKKQQELQKKKEESRKSGDKEEEKVLTEEEEKLKEQEDELLYGDFKISQEEVDKIGRVSKSSSLDFLRVWLLKSEDKMHIINDKEESVYRWAFPKGSKLTRVVTIIARLAMSEGFYGPLGIVGSGMILLQPVIRLFSRPQWYVILASLMSRLPKLRPVSDFVSVIVNFFQGQLPLAKPFLPIIDKILEYTYPAWNRFYEFIMNFVTVTFKNIFNRIFPSQDTISVTARLFQEGVSAVIQLVGLIFKAFELINFWTFYWGSKILSKLILKYGRKIITKV